MAMPIDKSAPVVRPPVVLGMLRKMEAQALSMPYCHQCSATSSRVGEAWRLLAILDGHDALYKGGKRRAERRMLSLLQDGFTRMSLNGFGNVLRIHMV